MSDLEKILAGADIYDIAMTKGAESREMWLIWLAEQLQSRILDARIAFKAIVEDLEEIHVQD